MTMTLYKNSQTEAESREGLYSGRWEFAPYTPASMFCEGATEESGDYYFPPEYTVKTGETGKTEIYLGSARCSIGTAETGPAVIHPGGTKTALFPSGDEKIGLANFLPKPPVWVPSLDELF